MPKPASHKQEQKKKAEGTEHTSLTSTADQLEARRLMAMEKVDDLRHTARGLFSEGRYADAFEAYAEYGHMMSRAKGLAGGEAVIVEGARKFEELGLWNEAGNLYLVVANFLTNANVVSDAAEFYIRAAETLEKAKDSRLRGLIATSYSAASQAFRSLKSAAESDRALMKGVIIATGKNPVEVESNGFKSFRKGSYQDASSNFIEATSAYSKAIEELSALAPAIGSGPLAVDVKSTLHHRAAQDLLAAAVCLSKSGKGLNVVREKISEASNEFTKAIVNYTPLFSLGEVHKEDYRRYSYDLMMATMLRTALGSLEDIGTLGDQLSYTDGKRTKELEESGYLSVMRTVTETRTVKDVLDDLKELHFGSIEELKVQVIELLDTAESSGKKK